MYKLLILILFLPLLSTAQDTITLGSIKKPVPLWKTGKVYFTENRSEKLSQQVLDSEYMRLDSASQPKSENYVWLKTIIHNDDDESANFDFAFVSVDSILVFAQNPDTSFISITGPYTHFRTWVHPEQPALTSIECRPGETYSVYMRLSSAKGRPFSIHNARIQNRAYSLKTTVEGYRNLIGRIEYNGFFLGAVTFAMIFFFFLYLKLREPLFLLYASYLLGAASYALIVKTLPYSHIARWANLNYPITYMLGEPVQYMFFAAYMAFGKALLDINHAYRWLNNSITLFTTLLLSAGVLLLLYNLIQFNYQLQHQSFIISRIIILPISIVLLIWIAISVQSPVKWFFVGGSSFFLLGGLLAVMVDPKSRHLFFGEIDFSPVVLFKSGILLESLCFALALGYKMRLVQKEKDKATRAYIELLEINKELAATQTTQLEKMVEERTAELLEKSREIEEQKQRQARADMESQLAEMEMRALRSQMNPHFIFNSLNSIRYQILKNDYANAALYLTRFSKLLRYILQNSREHVVPLSEEVEMNHLYVQLESLRFGQEFEYHMSISEEADLSDILVPSMLLQPYIENAIKHGLVPSSKQIKVLIISISVIEEGYCITIEDNGIGRSASRKKSILEDKQSLGMRIASERIDLFNNHFHPFIEVSIDDLFLNEIPSGTRVTFIYKI
jgi:hypothetical protein